MDCRVFAPLLLAALTACPASTAHANLDCSLPATDAAGHAVTITSRAELDAWLARCPSPLDQMTPGARGRFLDTLGFNERGVTRLPTGDLSSELTGAEIAEVFALLGVDARPDGLDPEVAEELRASRTSGGNPRGASDTELRYNALHYAQMGARPGSGDDFVALITTLFDNLFPLDDFQAEVEAASDHDLRLLYQAALTAAATGYQTDHIAAARTAVTALGNRNIATDGHLAAMHQALIHAGHLEESRRFAHHHAAAGLTPLPPLRESVAPGEGTPSALRLTPAKDALLHERTLLEPVRIVVVASYGCRYSRAAAQAIAQDPQLGPIFREHALWLASPSHLDNIPALQRWNDAHPATPLVIASSRERWPMLDLDTVPQFHVFRDGQLVASVTSGWPLDEGNRDAVLAALRKAGLTTDP